LAEPRKGRRGAPAPLRILGNHPADGAPVNLFRGRYGPYVSHDGVHATLPHDISPEEVTLAQAVELLSARAAKSKNPGKRKAKGSMSRAKPPARRKGPARPARSAAE